MSVEGLHLLLPLKHVGQLLDRYPYTQRRVIKTKDASWELHREHWITFTGMAIDTLELERRYELLSQDLIAFKNGILNVRTPGPQFLLPVRRRRGWQESARPDGSERRHTHHGERAP